MISVNFVLNVVFLIFVKLVFLNLLFFLLLVDDEKIRGFFSMYMLIVEFDFLCDDGFYMIKRLWEMNVVVEYRYFMGMDYGFLFVFSY